MCGISGILSTSFISVNTLVAMNEMISHRGPDDEGYVLFSIKDSQECVYGGKTTPTNVYSSPISYCPQKNIIDESVTDSVITLGMAHRRLAIVDLSEAGHQPMSFEDGRYWIVFNGEIYNHLELRAELENLGLKFLSDTDTEVVLAAYAFWGQDCLSRFNGMWAIAIFDKQSQELFFARDRFGIKPFYYWCAPDGSLCFGSEIKQFTAHKDWKAYVNRQRAVDYLNWGLTDHTEETLFDGVYQLRAGHKICFNIASWDGKKYPLYAEKWSQFKGGYVNSSIESCASDFKDKFMDSVRLHLRSDVPIGSCLSGGLDSSSIVCVANQLLNNENTTYPQKTFSACSHEEQFNERKWMEYMEKLLNIEAHYIYPTMSDLFKFLPDITWYQDEPFGSTSIFAQWCVFSAASKNGVKVMLDGQGADEQLAGYHEYFALRFRSLFYSGQLVRLYREVLITKSINSFSWTRVFSLLGSGILPAGLKDFIRSAIGSESKGRPVWLNKYDDICYQFPGKATLTARDSIRKFSEQQLSQTNLQMLLHWEDRNSMAHSIESRIPFLDYRLVDFSLNVPDEYKISDGITKRILRLAMKNILPSAICNRMDKMGFVTPEELWVTRDSPDQFRDRLSLAIENSCDLVNENIKHTLDEMIAGSKKFDFSIWRVIGFSEWVKCFSVNVE